MANGQTGGGSAGIAAGGIVNGAGGDADLLASIVAGVATLRSLKAGTNITLTEEAGDVKIDASGGGGTTGTPVTTSLTGGNVNLTTSPQDIIVDSTTVDGAGKYMITFVVGENYTPVTIAGATVVSSAYYLDDAVASPFSLCPTPGAELTGPRSSGAGVNSGGFVAAQWMYNASAARTIRLKGLLSAAPLAGNWDAVNNSCFMQITKMA